MNIIAWILIGIGVLFCVFLLSLLVAASRHTKRVERSIEHSLERTRKIAGGWRPDRYREPLTDDERLRLIDELRHPQDI